ncbi:alpha-ketoglutarate-dependent dioxygenase AlkB [Terriglobus sp. 2YAB30_2]|uniref:alpha-ketoglutarate-dependent dioxygenase AlkB n=1 Tax=unclassified Terriglobus TaxID=2628988 RepID=UPI003F95F83C
MEQARLFGGSQSREGLEPEGFRYEENFITDEEERGLLEALGLLDLKPFEFHGHIGNRRVTSFGLKYNFSRRAVETASDIPPFLADLLPRVASFARYEQHAFRQVGVNEYRAGAGIGWHKDKAEFGVIVGLSLGGPATMRFRKPRGKTWERVSHEVQPRSIYILAGEARTEWEHSIPEVSDLRYSITFRTLADSLRK